VYIRPSDFDSQMEIASRGAFLGYDGVSCDLNWGFRGSGPCDHELAVDVKRLIDVRVHITDERIQTMLVDNPRRYVSSRYRSQWAGRSQEDPITDLAALTAKFAAPIGADGYAPMPPARWTWSRACCA